jgi:hypothetical protein
MTRHEDLIQAIIQESESKARKRGFRKALREALLSDEHSELIESEEFEVLIVPDAYLIQSQIRAVAAFEVEISNVLSRSKLAKYLKLYQLLDYHNWAIKLVRVNRDGTAQAYDLFDCYAASLEREADLLDLIPLKKPWRIET